MGTMAATIAHELNQPIAAAINYLAVAECNIERSGRDADRDASEAVTAASDQMIRAGLIIRRMRSLVESGTPKSEPFDLVQSIERATDVLRASGDLEGFAVRVDPRPNARCGLGDEIQIEQVIVNILRNAARASTQCACREAVITCRRRGNMIEVSVRDRGPGVSPQLLEKLFVTMQSSSPEGLGVGLSLCRTIVEAHGGTIVARNEPSGGAVFAFTLPAAADGRPEAP